jgi:hypothetical protein
MEQLGLEGAEDVLMHVCCVDGFPQFNKKYGVQLPNGTYQVPARWQAGLSNVSSAKKNEVNFFLEIELMAVGRQCWRNHWFIHQRHCL